MRLVRAGGLSLFMMMPMFLAVVAGEASAKKVAPPIYRVMYAGGAPVESSNWTNSTFDTISTDVLTSSDSGIPWYPRYTSTGNSVIDMLLEPSQPMRIVRAPSGTSTRVVYTDDGKSIRTLGVDSVAGLFAHLRWNPNASLNAGRKIFFELDFHKAEHVYWEYLVYLDNSTKQLKVETARYTGRWSNTVNTPLYMRNRTDAGLDDTSFSNFDTSLVQNGWAGVEMKFLQNKDSGVTVQLRLADRQLFTDTTRGSLDSGYTVPYKSTSDTVGFVRLWSYNLGHLGDAAAIGQCKASDSSYQFAHKRFFSLERALDTLGKVIPASCDSTPEIVGVLYAPPGNMSTATYTSANSATSSYSVDNSLSSSVTLGVGYKVEPEALTGENGVDANVSTTISAALNSGTSLESSISTSQSWTLSGGSEDQVLYRMFRVRSYVLRHARLNHLFDTGTIADTNFTAYLVNVPDPQTFLTDAAVSAFVSGFGKDIAAMSALDSAYVKHRSTGKVDTTRSLVSSSEGQSHSYTGTGAVSYSGSVEISSTSTTTKSYSIGIGVDASLALTSGGFTVSSSTSVEVETSIGKSSSSSKQFGTTYSVADNVPWNEFNYRTWTDPVHGAIVFEWDSSATYLGGHPSYSSAPWDGHSRKAVDLSYYYSFAQGGSILDQPLTCTLLVANKTRYSPRSSSSILMPWIENSIGVKENGSGYDYTVSSNRTSAVKVDSGKTDTLLLTLTPPTGIVQDSITLVIPYGYQNTGIVHVANDTLTLKLPAKVVAIATRPTRGSVSRELAANIARSFASVAQGYAAAKLGTAQACDADDCQSVDVVLPSAANVQVSIYDNMGTPVISWSRDVAEFDLANLDATGDGRWVLPVSWNGRASDGTAVSAGVYLWKIVVRTEDGGKLETVKKLGLR